MNLIEAFIEYTSPAEAPESFFRWAFHTAIGAVMRDNCWVDTDIGRIYPNLYTILLSTKSSAIRKSYPMDLAYDLVTHVENTHIIAGRASLPGIIQVLTSMKTTSRGYRIKGSSAFLFSQELTGFLHKDPDTIAQITDWYDFKKTWPVTLKGDMQNSGSVQELKNLCVSLLGATNETNIPDFYTKEAKTGGLLARSLIIRESKRKHIKSYLSGDSPGDFNHFLKAFVEISEIKGLISKEPEAIQEFDSWYNSITDDKISSTGIEARIQTHALKVAMQCALSNRRELNIILEDMQYAIEQCVKLLPNYKVLSQTVMVNENVKVGALLLRELLLAPDHKLSTKQLLQRLWVDGLDKEELDKTVETYREAGLIEEGIDKQRAERVILLTQVALDKYKEKIGEKKV